MSLQLGDYTEDYATLNFGFTTRNTQGNGSPPFTLASGAISVYVGSSTTQSTAGITLAADFDGVTGLNNVLIDLSSDAFYATGQDYKVVITTGTVNSISVVGEVVATFSIENRSVAAVKTDTAAILVDTGTTIPGTITTIDNEIAVIDGIVDDILVDTATTIPGTLTTIDNEIATIDTEVGVIDGIVDAILIDTGTTIPGTITTIDNEIATIDGIVDDILVDTATTIPALVNGLTDITASQVLTQVNAALDTAISELGVAQPSATPSLRTGLMLLYHALAQKFDTQTSGTDSLQLHNAAGTLICEKLITDSGGDYSEARMISG